MLTKVNNLAKNYEDQMKEIFEKSDRFKKFIEESFDQIGK